MIDLGNRQILDDGTVICDESAAVELLYQGKDLSGVFLNQATLVDEYNWANRILDAGLEPLSATDSGVYSNVNWYDLWLTPEPYASMDVEEYCENLCATEQQLERVRYEMRLYEQRNMLPVLRHLVYMVADFRKREILWGVGRGSSVSSYVLYLIGINRINPLVFGLDISEFLK